MSFSDLVVRIISEYWLLILRGAGVTMLLALSGTVIGFTVGLIVGVIRSVPSPDRKNLLWYIQRIVSFILSAYVEIFRGTPMIVQAMVIYYGFIMITGMQINKILAGIVIVSVNTGAYMAEIVRGGIDSVDKGQFDAAHAIGMNHWQTMRCVIIPQTVRNILPATGNEFVINIKDTSVLNVISVTELYYCGKDIATSYFKFFEPFLIICVVYFILTFSVTRILRFVEKKIDGPQNYDIQRSGTSYEAVVEVIKRAK
ncbi:MAG: amino acid ABC transporter permease [Eubacteriales bacterium]|jgi:putative lysine transport system permease protein|nr:amino acid ABC transporter permease [Eubacteriales bacterium]